MRRLFLIAAAALVATVPVLVVRGEDSPGMPHGDLTIDCGECHQAERWTPVAEPTGFRHQVTGFPLEGAHRQASCRSCHRTLVFAEVGTACADCHEDAHRGELGVRCERCHTPASWSNQRELARAHDGTRFPLFGPHARLDCTACHRGQQPHQYATTPAECGECHLETWRQTTNPPHAESGFSRRCEDCHRVTSPTWQGAVFTHPASFPLTGGHAGRPCASCHTGGRYEGLSTECVSCHRRDYVATTNPNHVTSGFPTVCQSCHTTQAWRPAQFDHARTRFPLTGAHARLECARCHPGGRYAGTPTDCYACHQADYARTSNPNHQAAGFPTTCESCHDTSAWRPATFDHDGRYFPIYSGRHRGRWSACTDCHRTPGNYRAFECIFCHPHSDRAETDGHHDEVGGYSYQSAACYRCHPRGSAEDDFAPRRGRRSR